MVLKRFWSVSVLVSTEAQTKCTKLIRGKKKAEDTFRFKQAPKDKYAFLYADIKAVNVDIQLLFIYIRQS